MNQPTYVLVGEAPARDSGKTGLHLTLACKALGIKRPREEPRALAVVRHENELVLRFAKCTTHVNLLQEWPGAAEKGSHFPMEEATRVARLFLRWNLRTFPETFGVPRPSTPCAVLFAGRRVARAFRIGAKQEYFEFCDVSWDLDTNLVQSAACLVPHPSDVNRWWNDLENVTLAREFLEKLGDLV